MHNYLDLEWQDFDSKMIKPKDTENKFRLPRKVKKKLKKGFWLYLPEEEGSSLQANPTKSQEDY